MDSNQYAVIPPILMQRPCSLKDNVTVEEWARLMALRLQGEPVGWTGCGTVFQWWWGSGCQCPGCGATMTVNFGDFEKYRVRNDPRIDEREIVDRVLREVMVRLGTHR